MRRCQWRSIDGGRTISGLTDLEGTLRWRHHFEVQKRPPDVQAEIRRLIPQELFKLACEEAMLGLQLAAAGNEAAARRALDNCERLEADYRAFGGTKKIRGVYTGVVNRR